MKLVNVSCKLVIVLEQRTFISCLRFQLCQKIFCKYGAIILWFQNFFFIEKYFATTTVSQQGKQATLRPQRKCDEGYFIRLLLAKLINTLQLSVRCSKVVKGAANNVFHRRDYFMVP